MKTSLLRFALAALLGLSGCAADTADEDFTEDEVLAQTEDALDVSPSAVAWSTNV